MGHLFKPVATRPIPPGAEISERNGVRTARWRTARGGARTATVRGDRVVIPSTKYYARYKDGTGVTRVVPTGCKDESAARAVLSSLEKRAELVHSGILTPAQDAMSDHRHSSIAAHVMAYLNSLKANGTTPKHQASVRRLLNSVIAGCGFETLADIKRESVERWLANGPVATRAARTRNTYVNALKWFCNWCVDSERLVASPVARIRRADEKADRRRQPRALTPDELVRLLDAARRRPLAEAMRICRGKRKGAPWARLRPETREKLEALGQERALVYRTLVLTGLRLGELASLRVCDLVGDTLILDARHEKNREGSTIPLRADLAEDLRRWVKGRPAGPLLRVPTVKIFNRDLKFAGIPKRDERGRVAHIHALRTTFCSLLQACGVAPRVAMAAMRHSSIELTMSTYTDPRLLDVAGAMEVLPALQLAPNSRALTGTRG